MLKPSNLSHLQDSEIKCERRNHCLNLSTPQQVKPGVNTEEYLKDIPSFLQQKKHL